MVSANSLIAKTLSVAGPACFLAIQGSSIQTALMIKANESVGKLSSLPFISLFTNCAVWTMYGLRVQDKTVMVPNLIGVFSGMFCAAIYNIYAHVKPLGLYTAAAIIITFCTLASTSTTAIGSIGCALAVATIGSPLATITTVVRDRSTETMPFITSLMMWLNSLSWLSYGLFISKDVMIYGPNAVGLFLASIQMAMYVKYGMPGKRLLL